MQVKSITECSPFSGQTYCGMLQGEHSAILLTFIKLPFVIKILVLSNFELLFYTGFTVIVFLLFVSQSSIVCFSTGMSWIGL